MWRRGIVLPIRKLTDSSAELKLVLKQGKPRVRPGQFVVVEIDTGEKQIRASFSISAIQNDAWLLAVKESRPNGVSAYLNALKHPASVSVAGPFGDFTLSAGPGKHTFIAGGSGISPVFCMMADLIDRGVRPQLLYANESAANAMYLEELREWKRTGKCELVEVYGRSIVESMTMVHWKGTHVYVCGPTGFNAVVLDFLNPVRRELASLQTEHYGLPVDAQKGGAVLWAKRMQPSRKIDVADGETILEGAQRSGVHIDSACLVGACKTCTVKLVSGKAKCGSKTVVTGELLTACNSYLIGGRPIIIAPSNRLDRRDWFVVSALIGALCLGLWNVPPGEGLSSKGTMNTGHRDLECGSCHRPAEGSIRQQLVHNVRKVAGLHEHDWKAVGYDKVENAACIACHDRPNDRHPVSRFEELRFASQREIFGPHECVNCHGEHLGERVGRVEMDFCQHCHSDLDVVDDPVVPSHQELASTGSWRTCLTCHDFHGNHLMTVPTSTANNLREEEVLEYLQGGKDPYSDQKQFEATTNRTENEAID